MTPEKSVRQIANEMNEEARQKGMLLERDPWTIPSLYEGSILDRPMTPEEEARIHRLDALIARLERDNAAVVTAEQHGVRDPVREISVSVSTEVETAIAGKP